MPPTLANGKICYVEIPATDLQRSVAFYTEVFGWKVRQRGDGSTAFDDTTGEVSGTWIVGRPPSSQPGLLLYIMVDSVAATVEAVKAHGGTIVRPIGADAPEVTARFRDPGGNVIASQRPALHLVGGPRGRWPRAHARAAQGGTPTERARWRGNAMLPPWYAPVSFKRLLRGSWGKGLDHLIHSRLKPCERDCLLQVR